jgi:hypothetical protein
MELADAAGAGAGAGGVGGAVSGAEVGHACVLQQMAAGSDKVRCKAVFTGSFACCRLSYVSWELAVAA